MHRQLIFAFLALLLLGQIWFSTSPAENRPVIALEPQKGQRELCLTCHVGLEDMGPFHSAEAMGCVTCHGGNPLSLDEKEAHQGMRGGANPSALSYAQASCGGPGPNGAACHAGNPHPLDNQVSRVMNSLMATKAGEIAQVRYAFGAQSDQLAHFGVNPVQDPLWLPSLPGAQSALSALGSAAKVDDRLKQNCTSSCHLNTTARNSQEPQSYSAGCAACHVPRAPDGRYHGNDPTIAKDKPGYGSVHRITTRISYTQCNTCHNQGVHATGSMTFQFRQDAQADQPAATWEERVRSYYIPQSQFTRCEVKLDCVDCHTSQEVMGDGHIYSQKSDAQYIRCLDCHGTTQGGPKTTKIEDKADKDLLRSQVLGAEGPELQVGDTILVTSKGERLPYTRLREGRWYQKGKVTGEWMELPLAAGSACGQDLKRQDSGSCHQCHAIPHQDGS